MKKTVHIKKIGLKYLHSQTLSVPLDDIDIQIEPDSGADVNLMNEHQFKVFANRTAHPPDLQPSKIKLNTLQHPLPVKGEFNTVIRNQNCGRMAKFVVAKGRISFLPCFSKTTLAELGMLAIQPDGSLTGPNDMRIKDNEPQHIKLTKSEEGLEQMESIIKKYHHVFEWIGEIRDKRNDKEIYGQFHMKPEVTPVTQRPRPVPYHLQELLKQWIEQGLKEDIFEKVPETEPITWCSPLVVQPKPRFAQTPPQELGPHMIRASVDLRVPNKYMERSQIT